MQKVIRVKDDKDIQTLNVCLADGCTIVGTETIPFVTAVVTASKMPGIKVYGGWTDYIIDDGES